MRQVPLRRLFTIVLLLRGGRTVTAHELAEKFNVTLRTVYRDIGTLQGAGIPIGSTTGPGGGYHLEKDAGLDPILFASDATLFAFLTGRSLLGVRASDEGRVIGEAVSSADESMSADDREFIRRSRERILVDSDEWYWKDRPENELQLYKDAVMSNRVLIVKFHERDDLAQQEDTIEPYGLVWKGGFWYVVARSREEGRFRRFRIQRIEEASECGESFERQAEFDLTIYWREELDRFGTGRTNVVLRIGEKAIPEFENFGWKKDTAISKAADYWIVEMHVDRYEWLVPLVLSFGGEVAVVAPGELRDAVGRRARRLLDTHGEAPAGRGEDPVQSYGDISSRANKGLDPSGGHE